jgi:phage terminase small subunit
MPHAPPGALRRRVSGGSQRHAGSDPGRLQPPHARQIGEENLSKPDIAAAVSKRQAQRAARVEITIDRVLQEVAAVAFANVSDLLNADGTVKPIQDLSPNITAAIANLEVLEIRDPDGVPVGSAKKLRLADKLGALTLLMRHMGMLNDKLKLQGEPENPLTLLIRSVQGTSIRPVQTIDLEPEDA